MHKVIRDGKVAVLYSPGYGAGWYSWHRKKELLFDPVLVQMVLDTGEERVGYRNERSTEFCQAVEDYVKSKYPDDHVCVLGSRDLSIEWVSEGQSFKIDEYDGSESIDFGGNDDWIGA